MTAHKAPKSPRSGWIAPPVFALLTAVVLGGALLALPFRAIGSAGGDLSLQFIAWREFGFSQLRQGNLPLWNPHIFGGAPYFAGFQSALLYLPNWLHLFLSMGRAVNLIIALHVFAAGYFTYLWCRRRSSIVASILGGAIFMFCGPFFLHITPGHLPHLGVMIWIPLIHLAIDGIVEEANCARWWLLGVGAIAMQVLAGHPQYVYYTAIIATIYAAAALVARCRMDGARRVGLRSILFLSMYVAAAMLVAVQLFPAIAASRLTVRSDGLSYGMAGTFSLPPENLLTAAVPNALGASPIPTDEDTFGTQYFGRAYLWETSVFVSVTGLILASIGMICAPNPRIRAVLLIALCSCLLLALGRHVPIYSILYRWLPSYSSFRGTAKFAAVGAALIAMLAAIGFDQLRLARASCGTRSASFIAVGITLLLAMMALGLEISSGSGESGLWGKTLGVISRAYTGRDDNELFVDEPIAKYSDRDAIRQSGHAAAKRTAAAAAIAGLISVAIVVTRFRREIVYIVPAVALLELVVFARASLRSTSAELQLPQTWLDAVSRMQSSAPDSRVLIPDISRQDAGMYFGFDNLWGYDPGVLKRYAQLLYFSQGQDPNAARQYLEFRGPSINIFRALRCGLVLLDDPQTPVVALPAPLPTAVLIRNYRVMNSRDALFAEFASNEFDPGSSVLLESPPIPQPLKGSSVGQVEVMKRSTDALELKVQIETPAILLVTNNYTPEWRVRSLDAAPPQPRYEVQPANWTQQAIPLAAGTHHFLLEYAPPSFRVGQWVSIASLISVVAGVILITRRHRPMTE